MKKILICTGGTGGHIFPALSLAEHLKNNFQVDLITDYRAKRFINNINSNNVHFINVKTPTGKNGLALVYSIFLIFFSFIYSIFFILIKKPDLIIGSGGYASFPILLAARLLNKKFIIYETNSVVGWAALFLHSIWRACSQNPHMQHHGAKCAYQPRSLWVVACCFINPQSRTMLS